MRIGFIVEARTLRQEMPEAVIRALEARRNVETDVICPRTMRLELEPGVVCISDGCGESRDLREYDVLVSRTRNAPGLALLRYAEAIGVPTMNTHIATQRVRNKGELGVALDRAGVSCAPTVLADDLDALAELGDEWFPMILKPVSGDTSRGPRLVRRRADVMDTHRGRTRCSPSDISRTTASTSRCTCAATR